MNFPKQLSIIALILLAHSPITLSAATSADLGEPFTPITTSLHQLKRITAQLREQLIETKSRLETIKKSLHTIDPRDGRKAEEEAEEENANNGGAEERKASAGEDSFENLEPVFVITNADDNSYQQYKLKEGIEIARLQELSNTLCPQLGSVTEEFINFCADNLIDHKYLELQACPCSGFLMEERILLTLMQASDIVTKFPNKSMNLVHVSIGAGELLQTYMLVKVLDMLGYKQLTIYAIDPGLLDGLREKFNAATEPLAINAQLLPYNLSHSYLEAVKSGKAKPFHSIDLIDVGLYISEIHKDTVVDAEEAKRFTHIRIHTYRFPIGSIIYLPPEDPTAQLFTITRDKYIRKITNDLKIPDVSKETARANAPIALNEAIKIIRNLIERGFTQKEILIEEIFKKQDDIMKLLFHKEKPEWITAHPQAWFHINASNSPHIAMSLLVKQAAAVDNPVLYDGNYNLITRYHGEIDPMIMLERERQSWDEEL